MFKSGFCRFFIIPMLYPIRMLIFLHSSIRILEFHMHEELCQRLVEVGLLEIKIRTHFILKTRLKTK